MICALRMRKPRHSCISLAAVNKSTGDDQTQTEGWIGGLQLAMLTARYPNPAALIDYLGGNQRYILDYLVKRF